MSQEPSVPLPGSGRSDGLSQAATRSHRGSASPSAGQSVPTPERRRRRRALISAPVRVRSMESLAGEPDEISTTLDVSRNGFLFLSQRADFTLGAVVAVTFPYSASPAAIQAEQPGRVVRVDKMDGGQFAVAVALVSGERGVIVDDSGRELGAAYARSNSKGALTARRNERPLVLVVDSDAGLRRALKDFLDLKGYEVIALPGASQAHALLNQMLPELVIAEIEGEDLPGYDLCARIKASDRLRDVPVVLTTRSAYPSDYANAHSLGAIVCVAKPFQMDRMVHVVRLLVASGKPRRSS